MLLVEDDENHALLVMRHIHKLEVCNRVDHVRDGEEALRYLRREGEHASVVLPSIILLDLKLPKLSGHEVLRQIKQDTDLRAIPVIVLSTSNAEVDRKRAYELNANSYIVKPIDFQEFRTLISDIGTYWGVWNKPPPR